MMTIRRRSATGPPKIQKRTRRRRLNPEVAAMIKVVDRASQRMSLRRGAAKKPILTRKELSAKKRELGRLMRAAQVLPKNSIESMWQITRAIDMLADVLLAEVARSEARRGPTVKKRRKGSAPDGRSKAGRGDRA